MPERYAIHGPDARRVAVLLDELAAAPREQIHLPMPQHARLRDIAANMMANPGARSSVSEWGARVGMSERTLSRLVRNETGISFGQWQRQLHILLGLQRLAQGESVEAVALALGYESASAFIRMFKKAVGQSPGRFLAERRMPLAVVPAG
ncbi:hypothetical protein JHS3_08050 [Jeongeupia sp. HS-3]|uniref:helix-turn-helix domain-containing protein n=1 Tax=Jeongeupia sp. HS-3 TaxID=1009682 RepID=UPI0018A67427|nr:AraC family transcriptional regulator [Jeongeupia sp. HS-3]BCL75069.1 hypothetical protein JHS3_08050 [Jeongeupia sp. HS-3]